MAEAGANVGIETEDDIVVSLNNGDKIFEQDKSSIDSYPFNPSKIDLWKTLDIWLEASKADELDLNKTTLYLVTNKSKPGSLAEQIGLAIDEDDINKSLAALKNAGKNPSETIKEKVNNVLSNSDDLLKKLISRIRYKDGNSVFGIELQAKLISDLQLNHDDEPESIIAELYGWTFQLVVEQWRAKKPAIIERDSFIRKKNNCIKNRIEKIFNSNAIEVSRITAHDQNNELDSHYVEQLKIINCEQEEIIEAIRDYLSSAIKKTEISQKGYLTSQDFHNTGQGLIRRWKIIFNSEKVNNKRNPLPSEELGKMILYRTMDHNATIGTFKTSNYFLTNGMYHALADELAVGWHPEYRAKIMSLKKQLSNE
ncbi:hypothetical protein D4L85_18885 [Chryseolinea soli]|uniref:ABC-three component systems C-terminal domain-containing protein n=2 Tax=Chryseolinea soli TaxID=2321403 RepID=A0A385SNF3_9BACT|nr:hypothetical protein D4L85_18885 [Chryseolinea soli]